MLNVFFRLICVNFALRLNVLCEFMDSSLVFSKDVVEFVTVAAEYCAFVERAASRDRERFVDVLLKLLPLLYLKAAMLPEAESDDSVTLSECITEQDYDTVRSAIAGILGSDDDYLEVFADEMKYSDVPVRKCISEDLADIYQPLGNFVASFRSGVNEIMTQAVCCCREQFAQYWGQTLANTLRALHNLHYGQVDFFDAE